MKSLKELYRIGIGPSSSHTMAPNLACEEIKNKYDGQSGISYSVELFGSLADTGKGHRTDKAVKAALGESTEVAFNRVVKKKHPNVLEVSVYKNGEKIALHEAISLGGGAYSLDGYSAGGEEVYPHSSFAEIKAYCDEKSITLAEYVFEFEPEIKEYLFTVWSRMQRTIEEGLTSEGVLPGGLKIERKAKYLFGKVNVYDDPANLENMLVCAYAFACAEQNAAGGTVVTAPTCGSCGVVPACLYYMQKKTRCSDDDIVRALAVGGVFGNLIKKNASISGAECGCQAEIGSACSMAAAAICSLEKMNSEQTEYAAEVAMEHHLGLTCDPICGLVQIPCIERNAVAAMRAINAARLAEFLWSTRKISFDGVVKTMYATGKDLNRMYKETSRGGLAKTYKNAGKKPSRNSKKQ